MGSNPTLSSSFAGKISGRRHKARIKNEIFLSAVPDEDQLLDISLHRQGMKQDAPGEWFAIRTKPQQEQIAKLHYERQGYDSYLSMMWVIVRHVRRTEEKRRPFFPGYLFLHLAPDERNRVAISSTCGVLGPICFDGQYVVCF